VLACALVLVVAFASLVVFVTPVFGARSVAVVGTKTLTVERIRRAADISTGTPLARLDTGKVRSRILAIPEVRKATVLRSWPGTVRIKITERTPVAVIARNGQFVIVDSLGVPYLVEKTRPAELPLITVPNPNGVVIPNFATDSIPKKDKALVAAAATARVLTPELRVKLTSVDAPDQRHIQLKLTGGRVFFWGSAEDPTENVRKATVATVLLNRPGKTADVSTPGVVSVR
jgi:cell division protein FtsQ